MKNKLNREIGFRIRSIRENCGYSREAFEELSGVSAKFMYSIETGKKDFTSQKLVPICQILAVSSDYILFGNKNSTAEIQFLLSQLDEAYMPLVIDFINSLLKHKKIFTLR